MKLRSRHVTEELRSEAQERGILQYEVIHEALTFWRARHRLLAIVIMGFAAFTFLGCAVALQIVVRAS